MTIKLYLKRLYFFFQERTYNNRLKYIWQKNGSNTLVISFSGFTEVPSYNYIRTLSKVKYDKLYILDDFGVRSCYYWFENGDDLPRRLVRGFIRQVIRCVGGV